MDGYSIKEAAAVLGIPKRRVRELVARGVLAATQQPDGSFRVHLNATGAPHESASGAADPPARRAPYHEAGSAGPSDFEASPFRELLTEFRNLTERYGQALLALGEARGEVANLRGRIELLEARMDLRLPPPAPARVTEWRPAALPASQSAEAQADEVAADEEATHEAAFEPDQASEPETVAPEVVSESEPVSEPEPQPEPVLEAREGTPIEAVVDAPPVDIEAAGSQPPIREAEGEPEAPRRHRDRHGRFMAAGIAEALARAVDPTSPLLTPDELADTVNAYEAEAAAADAEAATAEEEPATMVDDFAELLALDGITVEMDGGSAPENGSEEETAVEEEPALIWLDEAPGSVTTEEPEATAFVEVEQQE
ncbi:MAG TPA: hypothetical protein VF030_11060, partial [Solirubrobacterales bacterium]